MTEARDDDRFRRLVESIGDHGIYMLDTRGRVTSWNQGAALLKGYSYGEVENQHFSRFFTFEDRRAGLPDSLLAQALEKGHVSSEGWRLRKDGSRFWASATVHAMRNDAGEPIGFAKVTRDMTEGRLAQQALAESERHFRLLVEGVADCAIYMLDPSGTVTNWNRGAERIKGYAAAEVVGRHFSLFYTTADRLAGLPTRTLETALAEGRFEARGWRIRKGGERFFASVVIDAIHDDDGRHVGFAKITRDITDAVAAQDALAESERQLRLLIGGVVDYALVMLDPNGIVTKWNAGAEKIKGYTAEEIIGHHMSRFYTPEDRAAGVPLRALITAAEEGRFESDGRRVRRDGSVFWASVMIDAIRDETGHLVGFAKITRDITERRQAEQALQRARDQLAQSQKLEALGQLTGGVAHDFNNILMVVGGQAQLLRNRLGDDARALRSLDAIESSARRGADLTRHLLAFARRQQLQPDVIHLADHLETLKGLVSASLPASIDLVVHLPATLWPIEIDSGELELAILNLAVNARDAMPTGGSLAIVAENADLTGSETDAALQGSFIALTVSDTGIGIPPDILPRVFDPFFTTKEVGKGTGLGLSQVFGFVQQSGGTVGVRSELGRGTTFTLYLPRSATQPVASATPDEGSAAPARRVSILVVEDNPEVAEVAVELLRQLGHRTRVVGNAAAALAVVRGDEPPDLVFSDIVMAGELDGMGLARLLREEHPAMPVLLATGYSKSAANTGDGFAVLRKPYQLDELDRGIKALLAATTGATATNSRRQGPPAA